MENTNENIVIKKRESVQRPKLEWGDQERKDIEKRILALSSVAIGALAKILIDFKDEDITDVVRDIKEHGIESGHLPIIIEEAESKEKVVWWIKYFEQDKE